MPTTRTYTHTNYFDREQVNELVGGAYHALEVDWLSRRPHIDADTQRAGDTRLEVLRCAWLLLLDPVP